jgi:hypothetical protein
MLTVRARAMSASSRTEATQFTSILGIRGCGALCRARQHRDDIDRFVKRDPDQVVLGPFGDALGHFAMLELDGDLGAGLDRRVGANEHSACRDISNEAEFSPAIDNKCANPQQTEVSLALAALGACRRIGPQRVECLLDLRLCHGCLIPT